MKERARTHASESSWPREWAGGLLLALLLLLWAIALQDGAPGMAYPIGPDGAPMYSQP